MIGRRREAFWLGGLLLWVLAVSFGSLLPLGDMGLRFTGGDKLLHLLAYASLGVWLAALRIGVPAGWLLLGLAFGLQIEWLQHLGGERQAEWLDALANGVGLFVGWLFGRAVIWRLPGLRQLAW